MSHKEKIKPSHLGRDAYVYVRQSTASQVMSNRESTRRQYKLVNRAVDLGWSRQQVKVIDTDLARSGSVTADRSGFTGMIAEVALGHVGLILSIEVSRVARSNSDWYRLLALCSVTDTLIGDEDGLYHPGLFNDRLLLGLKGTMAEAELHVIRARCLGGMRNKAARGELRRALPVGFVWGDRDGEVRFDPDEALTNAIGSIFEKFAEVGSIRQVWLWFQSEGLLFPFKAHAFAEIKWILPTYTAIRGVLNNPAYAGAYAHGKTRQEQYVDESGRVRKKTRRLPESEWAVLIRNHHAGFIDWKTYRRNRARIASNTRPRPHQAGGAVREGRALLQGIAVCGRCGRRLRTFYHGKNSTPGYYCANSEVVNGRGVRCLRVGGVQIDRAVARTFLEAVKPAGMEAALRAEERIQSEHEASLTQWRLQVERTRYEAERAERRYRAVEPENRTVARTLENEWEERLGELEAAEVELAEREHRHPCRLTDEQRERIRRLGTDLESVWDAPTTTDRERKELLRTLLEEVKISMEPTEPKAHLTLRWRGGAVSEVEATLHPKRTAHQRTDEDTVDLVRRLAVHYSDAIIAGILNKQGRRTVRGDRFTASKVYSLRRYWKIPRCTAGNPSQEGVQYGDVFQKTSRSCM